MCDGIDEAKSWAFGGPERHKVVSLDGTVFAKAGLITGGTSSSMDARAQRWDEKAVQDLRQVRECCSVTLVACGNPAYLQVDNGLKIFLDYFPLNCTW